MSDIQMQNFMAEAATLDFADKISLIKILLESLKERTDMKDTSFIDEACGCISHEQAQELRDCCGMSFKEV